MSLVSSTARQYSRQSPSASGFRHLPANVVGHFCGEEKYMDSPKQGFHPCENSKSKEPRIGEKEQEDNESSDTSINMTITKINCLDCINYHNCPAMKGKNCEGVRKTIISY